MRVTNTALTISSNGDLSQATLDSSLIHLDQNYGFSIQCIFTGTPTGTLKIQGSNDVGYDSNGGGVVNWSDIAGATIALTGAAGSGMFNLDATYYKWARLFYTRVAGSGTLTARLNSKGV